MYLTCSDVANSSSDKLCVWSNKNELFKSEQVRDVLLSLPLPLSLLFLFISQDKPDAPALHIAPKEATVTFENVHFSYTLDRPILNGLDFRVPAGKKVALVGGSGSG